jgi:hypothetical protein
MLVAGVLASLISALTQHRLFRSVRVEFPHVWSELGKRPCWFCSGGADPEYSLASWYLVMQAEYRLLPESQTRRLGYQAWCSAYAAVAVLVFFWLCHLRYSGQPLFRMCLSKCTLVSRPPVAAAPNPSIERTSYRWLRHRKAAAHVER